MAIAYLLILSLIFLLNLSSAADTDPSFQYNCVSNEKLMANSTYGANLRLLLTQLSVEDFSYGFSSISVGGSPNKVNAIGLCRGDQMEGACRILLNRTILELQRRCSDYKEAIGWSDYCMVRYSSNEIFGVVETYPSDVLYGGNTSDFDGFSNVLSSLLNDLTSRAASGGPFRKFAADNTKGTDSFPKIYALEQCTPDLSQQGCNFCLATAIERIETSCYGRTGCRVVQPSCNVRYEINPFFAAVDVIPDQSSPPQVKGNDNISRYWVTGIVLFVIICLCLCFIFICKGPRPGTVKGSKYLNGTPVEPLKEPVELNTLSKMHTDKPFEFNEIFEATNGFSKENKLGEGGFAEVYRGKLRGQEVAIKKLLNKPSKQDHSKLFKNEVDLVAGPQHPNLVKFYGSCSERNERLLIFELAPNGSLHDFLFDPSKREQLDWEKRKGIIRGIACGLRHLHNNKMIHRDLKASNILLDKNMNPKIADFGIAKHFKGDKSRVTTSDPKGTYGYKPPEYAIKRQNSLKLDVFSFGVLILEIVSGTKQDFDSNSKSILLSTAWENWNNKTISGFIDPNLREDPRTDQINICIQIGLLCVQDYELRPKMDQVVVYLDSIRSTTTLPTPRPSALLVKQEGHPPPDIRSLLTMKTSRGSSTNQG